MRKRVKEAVILIFLFVVMIFTFSYRFFYRSINFRQYDSVEVGMPANDVRQLLGEPVKITKYFCPLHGPSEVWRYNIRYSLWPASIWFKPDNNHKMQVYTKTWGLE